MIIETKNNNYTRTPWARLINKQKKKRKNLIKFVSTH